MIGAMVAVEANGQYNANALRVDLMPVGTLKANNQLTSLVEALLIQARLVYDGYQATSVRFICPVFNCASAQFVDLEPYFGQEPITFL